MDIFTLGAIFALFRGIFSLPGLALLGLEDIAVEMAVCAQLKGACKALTEDQLQPLIRKVEESAENDKLDFGDNFEEGIESKVRRLLCTFNYRKFCTRKNVGRSAPRKESALCQLERLNCKRKTRQFTRRAASVKASYVEEETAVATIDALKVLSKAITDAKVDVIKSVIGVGKEIGAAKVDIIGSGLVLVNEIVQDSAVAKATAEAAKTTVQGAFDVKEVITDAKANLAKVLLKTKADIFNSFFNVLNAKTNVVLCKLRIKKCMKEEIKEVINEDAIEDKEKMKMKLKVRKT